MYSYTKMTNIKNINKLTSDDLNLACKELALYLLGKVLVRKLENDNILKGRIVETECYLGGEDKASHSFGGRQTPGNEPMFMPVGTSYVYMTYGMYYCFNISSIEPGAAVLLRALEPISGIDVMHKLRTAKKEKHLKPTELCNGPAKLCMSFGIRKDNCNKINVCDSDLMWLEDDPDFKEEMKIVSSARIGIASAGIEWASKPLRFYILNNPHVSKRDRKAEKELCGVE